MRLPCPLPALCPLLLSLAAVAGPSAKSTAPKPGVALLVNESSSHISIDAVDGEHRGVKPSGLYELSPGPHTLRVRYFLQQGRGQWTSNTYVDYAFVAEPGTVLNVKCEEGRSSTTASTWRMMIVDVATGVDVHSPKGLPPRDPQAEEAELARNLQELKQKAGQGDAEAQYGLGLLFEGGQGVDRDPAEAVSWYRKAAVQGHQAAQYLLGMAYAAGVGVGEDRAEAFIWLSLAAANDDPSAAYFRDENQALLSPELLEAAKLRLRQREKDVPSHLPLP
jgi:hypothetical protein